MTNKGRGGLQHLSATQSGLLGVTPKALDVDTINVLSAIRFDSELSLYRLRAFTIKRGLIHRFPNNLKGTEKPRDKFCRNVRSGFSNIQNLNNPVMNAR